MNWNWEKNEDTYSRVLSEGKKKKVSQVHLLPRLEVAPAGKPWPGLLQAQPGHHRHRGQDNSLQWELPKRLGAKTGFS